MQRYIVILSSGGNRAVLIMKILKDFHTGHSGISRIKYFTRMYVCLYNMDKDIENLLNFCKNCALTAQEPPVKFNPWPKTDKPWSRLYIDSAGPIKGTYYFILVVNFTKWPEDCLCKVPTIKVMIYFYTKYLLDLAYQTLSWSIKGHSFLQKILKTLVKSIHLYN